MLAVNQNWLLPASTPSWSTEFNAQPQSTPTDTLFMMVRSRPTPVLYMGVVASNA